MKTEADEKVLSERSKMNSASSGSLASTPKTVEVSEKEAADYKIPKRYYAAVLILLPVNPSLAYIYWDMDKKTEDMIKNQKDMSIALNIIVRRNNKNVTIEKVVVKGGEGNYYLNSYLSGERLGCEIGLLDKNGKFKALMSSNEVSMPKDTFSNEADKTLWMTKGGEHRGQRVIMDTLLSSLKTSYKPTSGEMGGQEIFHRILAFITMQKQIPNSFSLPSSSTFSKKDK